MLDAAQTGLSHLTTLLNQDFKTKQKSPAKAKDFFKLKQIKQTLSKERNYFDTAAEDSFLHNTRGWGCNTLAEHWVKLGWLEQVMLKPRAKTHQ